MAGSGGMRGRIGLTHEASEARAIAGAEVHGAMAQKRVPGAAFKGAGFARGAIRRRTRGLINQPRLRRR
jgi:hypothetical protein